MLLRSNVQDTTPLDNELDNVDEISEFGKSHISYPKLDIRNPRVRADSIPALFINVLMLEKPQIVQVCPKLKVTSGALTAFRLSFGNKQIGRQTEFSAI